MSVAYDPRTGKAIGQVCGIGTVAGTVRILTRDGYATVRADSVTIRTLP